MSNDKLETIGKSLVQHGPSSDRVYLMKLSREDFPEILSRLCRLSEEHGYTKIFAKVPRYAKDRFRQDGYRVEAVIPRFYQGQGDAFFMARYFHSNRLNDPDETRIKDVLHEAQSKKDTAPAGPPPGDLSCRLAGPDDCEQMSLLYRQVFASYPFPIHDPGYLRDTMADHVVYAGIWKQDRLLALASAETDPHGSNAELTDFATDPDWRGKGLANHLMQQLEEEMARRDIATCYTIARATSFGMNICFARNGYQYSGTLVKNTQISGGLESMNVWFKHLLPIARKAVNG